MDSQKPTKVDVTDKITLIKTRMPETYKAIQRRAETTAGTFEMVRRGLRGEANCFLASEGGWVMGTPFNVPGITADIALAIVEWGCGLWVVFGPVEVAHGAH